MDIKNIAGKFGIMAETITPTTQGLINKTWKVTDNNGKNFVLQEINVGVFTDPDGLMRNIVLVTEHLRKKVIEKGGNPATEVLHVIPSEQGMYCKMADENGNDHYYRVYDYINGKTYDEATPELLYQAGVGFGRFQNLLRDFPANALVETIPDFHNTIERYHAFSRALDEIKRETYFKAKDEIYDLMAYREVAAEIMKPLLTAQIPFRVVHNDTKLNNVMLDTQTHKPLCVVDLDTIMPGSMLFDFGDAVRSAANTGKEDDQDPNNVGIDFDKYTAFATGFLSEVYPVITLEELDLMSKAPAVLAYELALRFATDYIQGNKYFKCDPARPEHNLERTRAQLKLFKEFWKNQSRLDKINKNIYTVYSNGAKIDPSQFGSGENQN